MAKKNPTKKNPTNNKKEIIKIVQSFTLKLKYDYVSCFAGNATLFMLMSLFPMMVFIISMLSYLPVDVFEFVDEGMRLVPDTLRPFILGMLDEAKNDSSAALQSISVLVTLYCAARGVYAIIIGMNAVYGIRETRNYVTLNGLAIVYEIAFFGMLGLTLFLIIMGNSIYGFMLEVVPAFEKFRGFFGMWKYILMLVILQVLLLLIYLHVPNRKSRVRYELPGSLFSSIVWLFYSSIFSFYIDNIAHYSTTYGSLATIVIFMLWMYGTMYIVFIGAELNVVLRKNAEYGYNYKRTYEYYRDIYYHDEL